MILFWFGVKIVYSMIEIARIWKTAVTAALPYSLQSLYNI